MFSEQWGNRHFNLRLEILADKCQIKLKMGAGSFYLLKVSSGHKFVWTQSQQLTFCFCERRRSRNAENCCHPTLPLKTYRRYSAGKPCFRCRVSARWCPMSAPTEKRDLRALPWMVVSKRGLNRCHWFTRNKRLRRGCSFSQNVRFCDGSVRRFVVNGRGRCDLLPAYRQTGQPKLTGATCHFGEAAWLKLPSAGSVLRIIACDAPADKASAYAKFLTSYLMDFHGILMSLDFKL
jgi:hypothetical protein